MSSQERQTARGRVRIVSGPGEIALLGAEAFASAMEAACGDHGRFLVALAGGSTPRALYGILAKEGGAAGPAAGWDRTQVFFGDERCVPPDHPESNYRMAREALLSKVAIPAGSVHRMRGEETDPQRAALLYETELREAAGTTAPAIPRLDLVLLGMGPDGHTASLFPGSAALHDADRLVAAPFVSKLGAHRITLTPAALSGAARVVFLVSGAAKAPALREVLEGELRPDLYPAQCVQPPNGSVLWLVDADAASYLV